VQRGADDDGYGDGQDGEAGREAQGVEVTVRAEGGDEEGAGPAHSFEGPQGKLDIMGSFGPSPRYCSDLKKISK